MSENSGLGGIMGVGAVVGGASLGIASLATGAKGIMIIVGVAGGALLGGLGLPIALLLVFGLCVGIQHLYDHFKNRPKKLTEKPTSGNELENTRTNSPRLIANSLRSSPPVTIRIDNTMNDDQLMQVGVPKTSAPSVFVRFANKFVSFFSGHKPKTDSKEIFASEISSVNSPNASKK